MGAITLGLALALLTSHTSAQLPYERFNSDLLPEYAEHTFLPVEPAAPTVLSAADEQQTPVAELEAGVQILCVAAKLVYPRI